MKNSYDSRIDTYEHIHKVQELIIGIIGKLMIRMVFHDMSKLEHPEKNLFDIYTPKLANSTYGSDKYKQCLNEMKDILQHHYSKNRHHPEHHKKGIQGMSLVDLIEMLSDWLAATQRHKDGDILKSIELNQKRFRYSDELKAILINSLKEFS